MEKIIVIGGGASGLVCAIMLARRRKKVVLLERGERVGRKLSATGNGQGNLTHVDADASHYFSDDNEKVARLLSRFGWEDTIRFFGELGGAYLPDARGRVYPSGRQASALTDLLRRETDRLGVKTMTEAFVQEIKANSSFAVRWEGGEEQGDAVVLAAGGKAAKNFGTDGNAYALAQAFGHTVTPLSPVLVQLRCDPARVRGLRGIRADAFLHVLRNGEEIACERGDVLFTESGISGDAVFRASSRCEKGDEVHIDFLPWLSLEHVREAVSRGGTLCLVNNGLGRVLQRETGGGEALARRMKDFPLTITGTLGFDYAQATRGGIPLSETDESLQSVKCQGLFFTGEILNVDGECGGYNLQWAFTSAHAAAEGIV